MTSRSTNKGIRGSKGGGGYQPPNFATNRSTASVDAHIAIGWGPNKGIVGGAKGVYVEGTPLVDGNDQQNFERVSFTERFGYPVQPIIPGFADAKNLVIVNTELKHATPVIRRVTSADIDRVYLTLSLDALFFQNNYLAFVAYKVEVRNVGEATWHLVREEVKNERVFQPYEFTIEVPRPPGAKALFDIQITKTVADEITTATQNAMSVRRFTEVTDADLSYPNISSVGLSMDVSRVGGNMPNPSFHFEGRLLKVPNTYNPETRVHSGTWTGAWGAPQYTNNPAWAAYYLVTDPDQGLGIPESKVNKFSFYAASVYNDQILEYTDEDGTVTYGPRYTINGTIRERLTPDVWIDRVARLMHGTIAWSGGMVTLFQDKPMDAKLLVTRENMVPSSFVEVEASRFQRSTRVNVKFNDRARMFKQRVVVVDADPTAVQGLPFHSRDEEAWGVTNAAQATRDARWIMDTEAFTPNTAVWEMGRDALNFRLFDVVLLGDRGYSNADLTGRVQSLNGTTVVLDKPVTFKPGSTIDIVVEDGTIQTRNVLQTSGSHSTININEPLTLPMVEQAVFCVSTDVQPRPFRITKIKRKGDSNIYQIEAVQYDRNKWARIEGGLLLPEQKFIDNENNTVGNVTNIQFNEGTDYSEGFTRRNVVVSWQKPADGIVTGYELSYRTNEGNSQLVSDIQGPSYTIENVGGGEIEVTVYAVGFNAMGMNVRSSGVTATYDVDLESGTGSPLTAPNDLMLVGGGTDFVGKNVVFQWTNPLANAEAPIAMRDFEVLIKDPASGAVVFTDYAPQVAPGETQTYTFTFEMNSATSAHALRSLLVEVRCRDTNNKTSNAASETFSNAAPAQLNNITVAPFVDKLVVSFNDATEPDKADYMFWASTTPGFPLNQSTLLLRDPSNLVSLNNVIPKTTYYLRFAASDTFDGPADGYGLNVSGEFTATTIAGIEETLEELHAGLEEQIAAIEANAANARALIEADLAALTITVQSLGGATNWDSTKTYPIDAIVISGTTVYRSLQANNTNRNPATQPAWWRVVGQNSVNEALGAVARALSDIDTRVTATEGGVTTLTQSVTALTNTVNDPTTGVNVTASGLTALRNAVHHSTTGLSVTNTAVTNLQSAVNHPSTGLAATANSTQTLSNTINHSTTGLVATANRVTNLNSRVGDVEADVSDVSQAQVDLNGKATASRTLSITANGHIAGYRIGLDGTGSSNTTFLTDRFAIAQPNGGGTPRYPFVVGTTPNGASTVGIQGNMVIDGTLLGRSIAAQTITTNNLLVDNLAGITAKLGNITSGNVTISHDGSGGWGKIGSPGKWLDNNWGWIIANHGDGSHFFDFCGNGFRLGSHTIAGQSSDWWLNAVGFSANRNGLTISQLNVIGPAQIAGGAAATVASGTGSGTVNVPVSVPSGTTARVICIASHNGKGTADSSYNSSYPVQTISISGIGNVSIYPADSVRTISGEVNQMQRQYSIPMSTVASRIDLGAGNHTLTSSNTWAAACVMACIVAVRP